MFDINTIPVYNLHDVVCQRCGTENEYYTEQGSIHVKAICNRCNRYIKFLPQDKPQIMMLPKYRGVPVSELTDKSYIEWCLSGDVKISHGLSNALRERWLQL